MDREACVCDHGLERSDLCAEIIIITYINTYIHTAVVPPSPTPLLLAKEPSRVYPSLNSQIPH